MNASSAGINTIIYDIPRLNRHLIAAALHCITMPDGSEPLPGLRINYLGSRDISSPRGLPFSSPQGFGQFDNNTSQNEIVCSSSCSPLARRRRCMRRLCFRDYRYEPTVGPGGHVWESL